MTKRKFSETDRSKFVRHIEEITGDSLRRIDSKLRKLFVGSTGKYYCVMGSHVSGLSASGYFWCGFDKPILDFMSRRKSECCIYYAIALGETPEESSYIPFEIDSSATKQILDSLDELSHDYKNQKKINVHFVEGSSRNSRLEIRELPSVSIKTLSAFPLNPKSQ